MELGEQLLTLPQEIITRTLSNIDTYDQFKKLKDNSGILNIESMITKMNFTNQPWGQLLNKRYNPILDDSIKFENFDIDKYEHIQSYQTIIEREVPDDEDDNVVYVLEYDVRARYLVIHGNNNDFVDIDYRPFIQGLKIRFKAYGPDFVFVFYDAYYANGIFRFRHIKSMLPQLEDIQNSVHDKFMSYVHTIVNPPYNNNIVSMFGIKKVIINNTNFEMMAGCENIVAFEYIKVNGNEDGDEPITQPLIDDWIFDEITFNHITELKVPIDVSINLKQLRSVFPGVKRFYPEAYFSKQYHKAMYQEAKIDYKIELKDRMLWLSNTQF